MRALLLLSLLAAANAYVSYEGYKVISVTPRNEKQLSLLRELRENVRLDFWHFANAIDVPADIMVPPEDVDVLRHAIGLHGMNAVVINHNVQESIDAERERLANKPPSLFYDYNDYNDYDTIMEELDALVARCPEGFTCTLTELSQTTSGGYPLKVLFIGTGAEGGRTAHWVDATIHAREWLATATVMNIINRIFAQADAEAVRLLQNDDWYFVPMMNPDGYIYSWTDDRMWRKNRSPNEGSVCIGTDLNRNYDYNWSGEGASGNPCSDTYYGSSAASEPETQMIQDEANRISGYTWSFHSFHTYGYYWLWPYGDCSLPTRWQDVQQVADATCAAIAGTHNTDWDCGNSCATLYATSGGTIDYTLNAGILYSYVPELRGNGFAPPPSEIEPSFQEVWNGFIAMVDEIDTIEGVSK